MSDFPFPEIPDDEPDAGGGGGAVTINGQPIDVDVVAGSISIDPGDIEIGAVEIKNGADDTRAVVTTGAPGAGDAGLVVRIAGGAVGGGLTDAQLRATPVPISGAVTVSDGSGPLTIDGTVAVTGSVAVTGPLTDTQLRATPVPVSGTVTATTGGLTDTQLRATAVPVSGPLTDTQLRATPVPVSGTVTATTGGLTDTQLRATPVPVSGTVAVTTGFGANDLGKQEDVAHVSGDVGVMALFVRQDSQSVLAGTTGDYIPATTDNSGNLRVIAGVSTSSAGFGKIEDTASASGDTGSAVWGIRRDTEGTNVSTAGDYAEFNIDGVGRLRTVAAPNPVTATLANVAGSASSVTLIAANAARRGFAITNDSNQILYVKLGTTASTTSYYEAIPAATATQIFTLESQPGISYQGDITGIMPSANGNSRTTEFVAA